MVPEKSLGTGIGKIWYRKKVSVPVKFKILVTVILWYKKIQMGGDYVGIVQCCSSNFPPASDRNVLGPLVV